MDPALFTRPADGAALSAPVLVVGGSTAAFSATLGALEAGEAVCLVQPCELVGGQFTSQALPASDDPPVAAPLWWLPPARRDPRRLADGERFAFSRGFLRCRRRMRALQPVAGRVLANPGAGWVSHFAVTPATALAALEEQLLPYLAQGRLTLIPFAEPLAVALSPSGGGRRRVGSVTFRDRRRPVRFRVEAAVVIEASDLGDLLELGGIPSRVGQEARADTGEAALPERARPRCQQAFTFGIVVEQAVPAAAQRLPAPPGYGREAWLDPGEFPHVFWVGGPGRWQGRPFFGPEGIFRYRRLACSDPGPHVRAGDVTVLNWGTSPLGRHGHAPAGGPTGCGNDYVHGILVGVDRDERERQIARGRDRARAYLHCLQCEHGLAIRPRGDLTWTPDGIAREPYVREARRGVAVTTVRHEDVARRFFPGRARARCFDDSIGVGDYHYLDFHPNQAEGHVDLGPDGGASLPFTIPLGALIPIATDGLVLSAKSIGTTHITNAAYRMHPVEWAIGEAGGRLAAFALREGVEPRQVQADLPLLRRFQGELAGAGVPLVWFDDIGHDDPDFAAIQAMAVAGIVFSVDRTHLHFLPEASVSRGAAAVALAGRLGLPPLRPSSSSFRDLPPGHDAHAAVEALAARGIVAGVGGGRFAPGAPISRGQLASLVARALPGRAVADLWRDTPADGRPLRRRELSRILHRLPPPAA